MEAKIFKSFTCSLMSRVFIVPIVCFFLVGCSQKSLQDELNETSIIKLDGCEYLACRTHAGWMVYTHKGDCSNPIHIYNVEKPVQRDTETIRKIALNKLTSEEKESLGIKE